jgi:ABC-type multidrug transport system fused ATPase/permease subunit
VDAAVTISVGSIVAFVGFLMQVGLTIGAIAFSHGQLNQRVRAVEEKQKDHGSLATSVTRLETEMEGVSREIKGLREDLRIARNELHAEVRQRPHQRGYTPQGWVEDERDDWGVRT